MTPLESWFWLAEIAAIVLCLALGMVWFVSKMLIIIQRPTPPPMDPMPFFYRIPPTEGFRGTHPHLDHEIKARLHRATQVH